MMTDRWQKIIETLSVVKSESVKVDTIKSMLDYDRTFDSQVLDNLYILGILSLDEYKARIAAYIERLKETIHWAEDQLKTADEKGAYYNPMIYYGFCSPYRGAAIENKVNGWEPHE